MSRLHGAGATAPCLHLHQRLNRTHTLPPEFLESCLTATQLLKPGSTVHVSAHSVKPKGPAVYFSICLLLCLWLFCRERIAFSSVLAPQCPRITIDTLFPSPGSILSAQVCDTNTKRVIPNQGDTHEDDGI